ncbi:MAG TPA: FtsX-like permease family protein [Stellaceae bacterium]|jgi:putative ABC transport system permease protein|nr:FtsX-like permease family protein [Stellaceae bacterium]
MPTGLGLGVRLFLYNKRRFAIAVAAVAVAAVIMFVEFGFLTGVLHAQSNIADLMRADLVVMDISRVHLHRWDTMQPVRLDQIAAMPEVAKVVPIYEDAVGLKSPEDKKVRRIMVFAIPPDEIPLAIGNIDALQHWLKIPRGFLFDRLSRPIYGPITPGKAVKLDKTEQDMLGYVRIGPDLVVDGTAVMSVGDWLTRSPDARPIMGAIRLKPGADPEGVRQAILARLPYNDITVMTPGEMRARENAFTLDVAPIGILFTVGMIAGLVIGTVTCYQLLFNEVLDRLSQFATLKAMGFSNAFLCMIVTGQALLLSVIGFAVGYLLTVGADHYVAGKTMLPIRADETALVLIFPLTVGMCILAGLVAMRRVVAADPAALY